MNSMTTEESHRTFRAAKLAHNALIGAEQIVVEEL